MLGRRLYSTSWKNVAWLEDSQFGTVVIHTCKLWKIQYLKKSYLPSNSNTNTVLSDRFANPARWLQTICDCAYCFFTCQDLGDNLTFSLPLIIFGPLLLPRLLKESLRSFNFQVLNLERTWLLGGLGFQRIPVLKHRNVRPNDIIMNVIIWIMSEIVFHVLRICSL